MSDDYGLVFMTNRFGVEVSYKLVEFTPDTEHPEQKGCYLLKPVSPKPNFNKMTKAELIEYINDNMEGN